MNLTLSQALFVKFLRIRCEGSWRWIASKYQRRYGEKLPWNEDMTFGGNQIVGMELCDAAMNLLNESVEDGWN